MVKNSQHTEAIKRKILDEAERIEEDCLYSAKGHFQAGRFWGNFNLWIGIPTTILAAVGSATALSSFDSHGLVAGILAIIVAALSAVATFVNPVERADTHLSAGNKYNSLRNRARTFGEIDIDIERNDKLLLTLKDLSKERDGLNQELPQIPQWAFRKARKGIEEGEAQYVIDTSQD